MIDASEIKKGFLETYLNNDIFKPPFCPFLDHDHFQISCPFEKWTIKLNGDLYTEYNLITHSDKGTTLNCKCMSWESQDFLTCPTYKKALEKYYENKAEFIAYYTALCAQSDFKFDKRNNPVFTARKQ